MELANQIEPRSVRFINAYARLLILQGAINPALKLLAYGEFLEPTNGDCQYFLGMARNELGDLRQARTHLEQALACWALKPEIDFDNARKLSAFELLGDICLRLGDADTAALYLARALQLEADSASLQRLMGICNVRLGRWRDAVDNLQRSFTLEPDNLITRGYLAFSHARQGNKKEAERHYRELLERFPHWLKEANERARSMMADPVSPDLLMARELALQACEASGQMDAQSRETLALVEQRLQAAKKS
jgi:tetratricopeptide (TPR) repeat protein